MKKGTKYFFGVAFGLIGLPIIAMVGITKYMAYPMQSFCDGIGESDTKEKTIERGRQKGLTTMEWDSNRIWLFKPEEPPMFRFACEVNFENGKVKSTSLADAD